MGWGWGWDWGWDWGWGSRWRLQRGHRRVVRLSRDARVEGAQLQPRLEMLLLARQRQHACQRRAAHPGQHLVRLRARVTLGGGGRGQI